eukprot:15478534-Alexandrium_andersonii.AAC.1
MPLATSDPLSVLGPWPLLAQNWDMDSLQPRGCLDHEVAPDHEPLPIAHGRIRAVSAQVTSASRRATQRVVNPPTPTGCLLSHHQ